MTSPKRTAQRAAAMLVLGGVIGAGNASAAPQRPTLDPGQVCNLHTVVSGDTLSKIAKRNGITLDEFIARNRHVTNPNLIWPGDVVVINCEQRTVTPPSSSTTVPPTTTAASPPPAPAPPAEVQRIVKPASIDVDKIIRDGARSVTFDDGCNPPRTGTVYNDEALLAALYKAGARGNQLIGLAAISNGEGNGILEVEGDCTLQTKEWDSSFGAFQIRAEKKKQGTGEARDKDALLESIEHQAWAAIQVYNGALAAGRDPLTPWTGYTNREGFRATFARIAPIAQRLGMLDGQ